MGIAFIIIGFSVILMMTVFGFMDIKKVTAKGEKQRKGTMRNGRDE